MEESFWPRVTDLLSQALELQAPARKAWLVANASGDERLVAEVTRLLDAHAQAGHFLQQPLTTDPAAAAALRRAIEAVSGGPVSPGARLGHYRLLREIGRGGMGTVYLGTRADDVFEQHVAIKIVPASAVSRAIRDRFTRERQMLATLEHAGIARVIDGGATDDGLQYLAMEYVDGVPIDEWCTARALDVAARVRLVVAVCDAVQYAHSRLIVHRDIKPSNILVGHDGRPRLLDFGIAALLSREDGAAGATMVHAWTPETAAPEQARGEPGTTATDVYGLGALLYRLITGRPVFDMRGRSASERMRLICEVVPDPPRLVARRDPEHAAGRIDEDLEIVILKALHKDPARRYNSVAHLADDLERHLAHRPVRAAPDRWPYRVRKFLHRHPVATAASIVAVTAVVLAAGVAVWQARRADEARARTQATLTDVRRLANTLIFDVYERVADGPNATPTRRVILEKGLAYLDRLALDAASDVALSLDLADAYRRLAEVQGSPGRANLGDREGAVKSLDRALALLTPILNSPAATVDVELKHLRLSRQLAFTVLASEPDRARSLSAGALAVAKALQVRYPGREAVEDAVAHSYFDAAMAAKPADQLELWTAANQAYAHLLDQFPGNTDYVRSVALTEKYLGANHHGAGRRELARDHYRRALDLDRRVLALRPQSRQSSLDVAFDLGNVAAALWMEPNPDLAQVTTLLEESLALREKAAGDDPQDVFARRAVGYSLVQLSDVARQTGHRDRAVTYGRRAVDIYTSLSSTEHGEQRANAWYHFGQANLENGRAAEGCRALRTAQQLFKDHLAKRPDAPAYFARRVPLIDKAVTRCGSPAS